MHLVKVAVVGLVLVTAAPLTAIARLTCLNQASLHAGAVAPQKITVLTHCSSKVQLTLVVAVAAGGAVAAAVAAEVRAEDADELGNEKQNV